VSPANADYNCGYNLAAGEADCGAGYGVGYAAPMTGCPGTNDIDEDPAFVDPTRNIATWDASLGGPGTLANAVAELRKLNTPSHNANYTVAALLAWVKAGFAPTNVNLQNAGHDNVTIGAVEYATAGASAVPGVGGIAMAGPVPTLVTPQSVPVALGNLVTSGKVPTVSVAAQVIVAPGLGALSMAGQAATPTLDLLMQTIDTQEFVAEGEYIEFILAPGLGAITVDGFAPIVITPAVPSPAPGALVMVGYAPSPGISGGAVAGRGLLVQQGFAPTVLASTSARPGIGGLTMQGKAPYVYTPIPPTPGDAPPSARGCGFLQRFLRGGA
jgi:hypothetical protein